MDQDSSYEEFIARLKLLMMKLADISKEDFELIKTWFVNIVVRGMAENKIEEVGKIIKESEGIKEMVYAGEIAIRNKMEEELLRGRKEGIREGIKEGKIEGKIEAILELLSELGDVSFQVRNRIKHENDMDLLKKWLKLAAKAADMQEFTQVM